MQATVEEDHEGEGEGKAEVGGMNDGSFFASRVNYRLISDISHVVLTSQRRWHRPSCAD